MNTKLVVSILLLVGSLLIATTVHAQTETSISTTGEIESETGFRFPDGSLQTTKAQDELYYLDCQDGQATVYDAANLKWICADPLQGPQGDPGTDGADGAPGTPGAAGVDGEDGADGANCYDSIGTTTADCIGAKGDKGDDGLDGTSCTVAACPADGVTTLSCGDGSQVQIACVYTPPPTYAIGDTGPAGGIVFYVEPGSNGQHGLEAAPADQSSAQWGCVGADISGAGLTAIGTGSSNTEDIIQGCPVPGIAAAVAVAYVWPNGQTDGFLPSRDELNLMYDNLHDQVPALGGFADVDYWSSSEATNMVAMKQDFLAGSQVVQHKGYTLGVRAVRAF